MLSKEEKKAAKRAYLESLDKTPPPRPKVTLRDEYKRLILDPFFGKRISDLILPPRKQ